VRAQVQAPDTPGMVDYGDFGAALFGTRSRRRPAPRIIKTCDLNNAPCPPFASHGASIMLQYWQVPAGAGADGAGRA
jgi:hypothetical protein